MKRKIITIDGERCNGCGNCIPGCPEGALQVIDGKARLISDLFCDGLGACIGECPVGAITVEEREAEPYDERQVMANITAQGPATIAAHLEHLRSHNEAGFLGTAIAFLRERKLPVPEGFGEEQAGSSSHVHGHGCPGAMAREIRRETPHREHAHDAQDEVSSELTQWPVQLQLINPMAPFFKNADIVIAADCVAFSYANFHARFLKGKKLIIFCPKLDTTIDHYIDKLTQLFAAQGIRSVTIAHMEVPCCFGVKRIVQEAMSRAGYDIPIIDHTVSINGEIVQ